MAFIKKVIKEKFPDIKVTREQTANWKREEAESVMENWLASGQEIDGVAADNDEMALGPLQAIKAAGKLGKICVGGIDATHDALGGLNNTVFQDVVGQGEEAVNAAYLLVTRDHRIFDPKLAGGPLLDLGTYPVSLLTEIFGVPKRVVGLGQPDSSGVNGQLSAILIDAEGNQGTVSTTLHGFTPANAVIVGTEGTIRFDGPFNLPGAFVVTSADGSQTLRLVRTRSVRRTDADNKALGVTLTL